MDLTIVIFSVGVYLKVSRAALGNSAVTAVLITGVFHLFL